MASIIRRRLPFLLINSLDLFAAIGLTLASFAAFHIQPLWDWIGDPSQIENPWIFRASKQIDGFFSGLQYQAYDYRYRVKEKLNPVPGSDRLVMLGIDDDAVELYGRWPWPRTHWTKIIRTLQEVGVDAIYFDVEFQESADVVLSKDSAGRTFGDFLKEQAGALQKELDPDSALVREYLRTVEDAGADKASRSLFTFLDQRVGQLFMSMNKQLGETLTDPDKELAAAIIDTTEKGCPSFGLCIFHPAPQDPIARRAYFTSVAIRSGLTTSTEDTLSQIEHHIFDEDQIDELRQKIELARYLNGNWGASAEDLLQEGGFNETLVTDVSVLAKSIVLEHALQKFFDEYPERVQDPTDKILTTIVERIDRIPARSIRKVAVLRAAILAEQRREVFSRRDPWEVDGVTNISIRNYPNISPAVPILTGVFTGMGSATAHYDSDGYIRRMPLFWKYQNRIFPHVALSVALHSMGFNENPDKVLSITKDHDLIVEGVNKHGQNIRQVFHLDPQGRYIIPWAGQFNAGRIPIYSLGPVIDLATAYEVWESVLARDPALATAQQRVRLATEVSENLEANTPVTLDVLLAQGTDSTTQTRLPAEWLKQIKTEYQIACDAHVAYLLSEKYEEDLDRIGNTFLRVATKLFPDDPNEINNALSIYKEMRTLTDSELKVARGTFRSGVEMARKQFKDLFDAASSDELKANRYLLLARDADISYQSLSIRKSRWNELTTVREAVMKKLGGKVCLIGATMTGGTDFGPIPLEDHYPKVGVHANIYNGIMTGEQILTPDQAFRHPFNLPHRWMYDLFLWILVASVVLVFLPRVGILKGAALFVLGSIFYLLGATFLLVYKSIWIDLVGPLLLGSAVFTAITLRRYVGEERSKLMIRKSFETMVDPKIVEAVVNDQKILKMLGGANFEVTAFFSDIEGFTTMSELLAPEELASMLVDYLTPMTDIIVRDHGGTRDKYIGDAIVAFWGAPLPVDDHAIKGCLAALEQQEILIELKKEWIERNVTWYRAMREKGKDINFRIGMNTGVVKVGSFGSRDAVNYTMIGDAVNLAARLEGANKPYRTKIMISDATYLQAREAVEVRELDRIQVKGKLEPVTVFELLGRKGKLDDRTAERVGLYHQGLQLYRGKAWKVAGGLFEKALAIDPHDGPSLLYRNRCADTDVLASLPDDWNGVYVMTTK